jgi:outer membrane murein-binding lipoprotein Lpp
MDEIKELLAAWVNDGCSNPGALLLAHAAIVKLVDRVETLEAQVATLSNN